MKTLFLDKSRTHGVEADDVEALLRQPVLLAGRIVQPEHDEPRWLLLGQDDKGIGSRSSSRGAETVFDPSAVARCGEPRGAPGAVGTAA